MSTSLPDGAILLARDEDGRAFVFGDHLVIERKAPTGKRVEIRLPAGDLDWLWNWSQLMQAACDRLAVHALTSS